MAAAVSGLDLNHLPDVVTRAALLDVLHGNLLPYAFPDCALSARSHAPDASRTPTIPGAGTLLVEAIKRGPTGRATARN
jgi:hypothetical protein